MPRQATIYRILIASPSDTEEERKAIPEVIHAWNTANSQHFGVMLEPVLWETHATPEMGDRPQAIINKQLVENSDILIGTFWTRIGTHTGRAESGTVEEIEEFLKIGKPVLLYFSSKSVRLEDVDQEQYKRLLAFKKRCQGEGLVFKYESIGELRNLLQGHITTTVETLHKKASTSLRITEDEVENKQLTALQTYKSKIQSFISRLKIEWNAEKGSEPIDIEEGKNILENAYQEILNFRVMVEKDEEAKLTGILDEVTKRLKAHLRFEVYIDGGQSFRAFWTEGDQIIELLDRLPNAIFDLITEEENKSKVTYSEIEKAIINYLKEKSPQTIEQISEGTGYSSEQLRPVLTEMDTTNGPIKSRPPGLNHGAVYVLKPHMR